MTSAEPKGGDSETASGLGEWRDLVRDRFVALEIDARDDVPFAAAVGRSRTFGTLDVTRVRSGGQTFRRTPGLIRRHGEDVIQVGYVRAGAARLRQDGRDCGLDAGHFAIYDATRPFTWTMPGPWTMDVFTWPRRAVGADDDGTRLLTARTLHDGPAGQVAGAALAELGAATADLGGADGVVLAARVADLVLGAASWNPDPARPATDVRVDAILDLIELNLQNPVLTAGWVARQCHLSPRSLQRLFAGQPRGVADWIRYRRLDRARSDLARDPRRTVASVAAMYCFSAPTVFARAFRNEFGHRPGEMRAESIADPVGERREGGAGGTARHHRRR